MGGYNGVTCCATSNDGLEWTRPSFDVKPGDTVTVGLVRANGKGGYEKKTVRVTLAESPLSRIASQSDLSPQERGEVKKHCHAG